jgi:catalase
MLEAQERDHDFVQAGALYRLMPDDAKARLVENLAGASPR